MRVYLDNCCFNRPFDDPEQARIRLEAEAKICIQDQVRAGALEMAWSYILAFENSANPFEERRKTIAGWKERATVDVEETGAILHKARSLAALGLKAKDALHVACAIAAKCQRFVTTDDEILELGGQVAEITVVDPPTLVRELNL